MRRPGHFRHPPLRCSLLRVVAWTAFALAASLSLLLLVRLPSLGTLRHRNTKPVEVEQGDEKLFAGEAVEQLSGPTCQDADAERCLDWACGGECESNPGFMNTSCSCSCAVLQRRGPRATVAVPDGATRVVLTPSWTGADGKVRSGRIRITLDPDDAPRAVSALLVSAASGACAPAAVCRGLCHFHRAETGYGLVQGYLAGLRAGGGTFGARSEGSGSWKRGTVGYIPGGDNLLIATIDHPEWDTCAIQAG
jgi:hypothetical protein